MTAGNGEHGRHGEHGRYGDREDQEEHEEHGDSEEYEEHGVSEEHEEHGVSEEHDEHEEQEERGEHPYGGLDALMAAITGEPVPEEARRDPAFLAEHRAAEADVAVLRAGLGRLAAELDPPVPARPVRTARPVGNRVRRPFRVVSASLAAAAVLGLLAGIGWLGAHPGGGGVSSDGAAPGGKAGRPTGPREAPACAEVIVEGTVVEVAPQGSRSRVTVAVERSYRPAHGPTRVGFLLGGDARPDPRPGQHVLVEIGRGGRDATRWTVGDAAVAAERARIEAVRPGSGRTACPGAGAAPYPGS
ncbi:hypothetical protein Shyhy01_53480 [Streptomyces hygroscopicus subsp. hygroscopicus]|nr:hypothetical protein [Streptomyces hygroscopicus]GLX52398.1 hypothetical protein Shyhy01_53480 [Streptomyces hygroscopicus subsp. hygroscopicus]